MNLCAGKTYTKQQLLLHSRPTSPHTRIKREHARIHKDNRRLQEAMAAHAGTATYHMPSLSNRLSSLLLKLSRITANHITVYFVAGIYCHIDTPIFAYPSNLNSSSLYPLLRVAFFFLLSLDAILTSLLLIHATRQPSRLCLQERTFLRRSCGF